MPRNFAIEKAKPILRAWILSVHSGIEEYFPVPETTSLSRVRSILQWKAIDFRRRRFEEQWTSRFAATFRRIGDEIGTVAAESNSIAVTVSATEQAFEEGFRKDEELLVREVSLAFAETTFVEPEPDENTEKALLTDLLLKQFEEIDPISGYPEMVRYLEENTARKIRQVTEATRERVRQITERAYREGLSVRDIREAIRGDFAFSRVRAERIARTEVIGASNAGTHFGYGTHFEPNTLRKEWLATADLRTRLSHLLANGQKRNFPEPFRVGKSRLLFPADNSLGAEAEEVVNCRCTTLYHGKRNVVRRRPGGRVSVPVGRSPQTAQEVRARVIQEFSDLDDQLQRIERELDEILADVRQRYLITRKRNFRNLDQGKKWYELKKQRSKTQGSRAKQFAEIFNPSGKIGELSVQEPTFPYWRLRSEVAKRKISSAKAKKATDFLNSLGLPTHADNAWVEGFSLRKGRRAFHSGRFDAGRGEWTGNIFLEPADDIETYVHELGHALDQTSPEFSKKVKDFYERRTEGETLEKLRDLRPDHNYDVDELTKKDKFEDPYTGKYYDPNKYHKDDDTFHSEITSMGVQQLYSNPARLAREDPDFFDFLWENLSGVNTRR